jgi:hypothetical protein
MSFKEKRNEFDDEKEVLLITYVRKLDSFGAVLRFLSCVLITYALIHCGPRNYSKCCSEKEFGHLRDPYQRG